MDHEEIVGAKRTQHKKVKVPAKYVTETVRNQATANVDRARQARDLRVSGATYGEIAKALSYNDASAARKAVKRAENFVELDGAMATIKLDLDRLDEYQKRATHALRNGDLKQIDRLMKIMQTRWQLLGVSPETVDQWVKTQQGSQQPGGTVTQNNTMIIQGTQTEYVRALMDAAGTDPNSPVGQRAFKQLDEAEKEAKKLGQGHGTTYGPTIEGETDGPGRGEAGGQNQEGTGGQQEDGGTDRPGTHTVQKGVSEGTEQRNRTGTSPGGAGTAETGTPDAGRRSGDGGSVEENPVPVIVEENIDDVPLDVVQEE